MTDDSSRIALPGGWYLTSDEAETGDGELFGLFNSAGDNMAGWMSEEQARAFAVAMAAPSAIPSQGRPAGVAGEALTGWVIVPVQATPEMIASIRKRILSRRAIGKSEDLTDEQVYNTMLAAAPKPPALWTEIETCFERLEDAVIRSEGVTEAISYLRHAVSVATRLAADHSRETASVREALEWYADKVAWCRKIGSAGDPARHALDADGGKRAFAALRALKLSSPDQTA